MQKIHIETFMAVELADIKIKKTVLLIGEQASGKSTIAKLVYFFKSLRDDYIYLISENLERLQSPPILQETFWAEISRKFYRFFGAIQHLPHFKIQYWYSDDKYITLEQEIQPGGRKRLKIFFSHSLYMQAIDNTLPLIKRLHTVYGKRNIFESSVYREAIGALNNHIGELFEDNRQPVFMPAGRNMAVTYADFFKQNFYGKLSSDLALIQDENTLKPRFVQDTYLMIQFLQRVQTIVDTFKGTTFETLLENIPQEKSYLDQDQATILLDKIQQILKGTYKHDENFGEIILFDDKNYVLLNNASSGQQEVIRILQDCFLTLVNKENVFRVIEEPEAHLFPLAQKHLLQIVALMLNNTDSQIILTTHSPYILSIINNLLFKSTVTEKANGSMVASPFYLKPAETEVYTLIEGQSRSIMNQTTGLIDQNTLDTISEELADEFEQLYEAFLTRS